MSLDVWITYVVASSILIAIPGPAMVYLVSVSLDRGFRAGSWATVGLLVGIAFSISLSLLGAGTLLTASASSFDLLKTGGGIILLAMGLSQLFAKYDSNHEPYATRYDAGWHIARTATLVSIVNPKVLIFYLAFLPQFINADAKFAPQAIILTFTFLVLAAIIAVIFASISHIFRSCFRLNERKLPTSQFGAVVLIVAGILILTAA